MSKKNTKTFEENFDAQCEEKRRKERIRQNIIRRFDANYINEAFHIGTPSIQDPYSGNSIYLSPEVEAQIDASVDAHVDIETFGDAKESNIADESEIKSEEERIAEEIYQRLLAEAAADNQARRNEIEALLLEQEATSKDYNAETGSYSGLYGKKPMSDSDAEALTKIMNANSSYTKSIADLIAENQ